MGAQEIQLCSLFFSLSISLVVSMSAVGFTVNAQVGPASPKDSRFESLTGVPKDWRTELAVGSEHVSQVRGIHVDSLTVIPLDLYLEFAMAGEHARRRGQHFIMELYIRDIPPRQLLVRAT